MTQQTDCDVLISIPKNIRYQSKKKIKIVTTEFEFNNWGFFNKFVLFYVSRKLSKISTYPRVTALLQNRSSRSLQQQLAASLRNKIILITVAAYHKGAAQTTD